MRRHHCVGGHSDGPRNCCGQRRRWYAHAASASAAQRQLTCAAPADTIVVTAGITVSSQLVVNRNLLVQGDPAQCATANSGPAPTAGLCTLSGGGVSRIFKVYNAGAAVTLTLSALALVSGSDVGDSLGGAAVLLLPGTTVVAPLVPVPRAPACVSSRSLPFRSPSSGP